MIHQPDRREFLAAALTALPASGAVAGEAIPPAGMIGKLRKYDQSALGRFDGENYNIGFLDICHRPYTELSAGAILSHERMYQVADGKTPPFADAPEYLPKLFL